MYFVALTNILEFSEAKYKSASNVCLFNKYMYFKRIISQSPPRFLITRGYSGVLV